MRAWPFTAQFLLKYFELTQAGFISSKTYPFLACAHEVVAKMLSDSTSLRALYTGFHCPFPLKSFTMQHCNTAPWTTLLVALSRRTLFDPQVEAVVAEEEHSFHFHFHHRSLGRSSPLPPWSFDELK